MKKIHKSLIRYTFASSTNKKQSDAETVRDLNQMKAEIEEKFPTARRYPGKLPREVANEYFSVLQTLREIQEEKVQTRIDRIKSKRVVGATCASTRFEVMKTMQFKIVILDECSQMLEPQSLLPISKFNCRKLVAVGDPLQLPPVISFNFKEKRLQQ